MLEKITVNAHSSIRIAAEKVIYIDPFQLKNEPHDGDIIFITHSHFDHFSPEDIEKLSNQGTVYVLPESMLDEVLEAGLPADKLVALAPEQKTEVCGIEVETVPSYNMDKPMHPKANGWLGYVITVENTRVYIGGDMDATPEAAAVQCDVAMIPVGGTYTMNPCEAAALINEMKPGTAIPTHYGSLVGEAEDGKAFAELVDSSIHVEFRL